MLLQMGKFHSFLSLSSSSLNILIYHIFFIHLPVNRHRLLPHHRIINNAAMNIGGMYLFKLVFFFFLNVCPGVESLDHMVVLFLT